MQYSRVGLSKVKEMNEYKIHKSHDYTVVCNSIFKNYSLSYKAKGLLLQMLSLPEGWDWSARGLSAMSTDGKESVESGIHELEKAGYLIRTQRRTDNGRMDGYKYDIFEFPITEQPMTENPVSENPQQYNGIINNTLLNNKVLNNTPTTTSACAKEGKDLFIEWFNNSTLKDWSMRQLHRNGYEDYIACEIAVYSATDEFYDNDFTVQERVERRERTDVLRHFQNWLPKYLQKLKEDDNKRTQGRAGSAQRPIQEDEYDFDRGCAKSRTNP